MSIATLKARATTAYLRVRARTSPRRALAALALGAGIVLAVGAVGVATEALIRARIVPPSARVPSALYTRPVAWTDGDRDAAVVIGPLNPALNEERIPVRLEDVPEHLLAAVLAVEDQRFYAHHGLDPRRIAGALVANVKAGGVSQGGSTITQQLAKNLFLTARRTSLRKIREAAFATVLELRYTKAEILEAYLNEIYLGQNGGAAIHGVGAAARYYFGKPVERITLAESALLAGMIRSPNRLAPTRHADAARDRRDLVLGLMLAQNRADSADVARARRSRVSTRANPPARIDGRYFRDYVAASIRGNLRPRGTAIYTTLDATLQRSGERAIARGMARLGKPGAQAALVAIDPRTGDVLAMVGGADYGTSQFNRAVDALRQPGSAFKPFVALTALEARENGRPAFTLATMVEDEPLSVSTPQGAWQPVNYDRGYRGEVTVREALEYSYNVPFARIGIAVGPRQVAATAQRLGITSKLSPVPSLALGSSEVTLLELVRAYGVLATQGDLADTRTVAGYRIGDRDQALVDTQTIRRVADPAATFLVTSALQGAVRHGTGAGLSTGRFRGDVAGKTGTSNDWRDAWFVAYSPTLVVGAWVGYDDGRSLRLAGSAAAVPIVSDFFANMGVVSGESFRVPDGVEEHYVGGNWWSCGQREYFLEGTAPDGGCDFRWNIGDQDRERWRGVRGQLEKFFLERLQASIESARRRRR